MRSALLLTASILGGTLATILIMKWMQSPPAEPQAGMMSIPGQVKVRNPNPDGGSYEIPGYLFPDEDYTEGGG